MFDADKNVKLKVFCRNKYRKGKQSIGGQSQSKRRLLQP